LAYLLFRAVHSPHPQSGVLRHDIPLLMILLLCSLPAQLIFAGTLTASINK